MNPLASESDFHPRPVRLALMRPSAPLVEPPAVTQLDRLLEPGALRTLFQPIFDLRLDPPLPCAVESLTRGPEGTTMEAPDVLFEYARRKRAETRVDRAAVETAIRSGRALPSTLRQHVNVHASTLSRDTSFPDELAELAARHGVPVSRYEVEIVEHGDLFDEAIFLANLERLRALSVGIALDDIGRGRSNFRMMLLARPDILKIDRYLVDGIAEDPVRRAVVEKVREVSATFGGELIVEGIERHEDLAALRSIGVLFGQGFLLARPMPADDLIRLCADLARDEDFAAPLPIARETPSGNASGGRLGAPLLVFP